MGEHKLKSGKCLICQFSIPKNRMNIAVTCKKDCAKIYFRVNNYICSNMVSKYKSENRHLKKKLKLLEIKK